MTLFHARGIEVRLGTAGGVRPGRLVIDDLDVTLEPGAVMGVVGPSGSGKTTLLRTLAGLVPLTAGELSLEGKAIEHWEPSHWRRRIGLLPQRPFLFVGTVADNLDLPGMLRSAHLIRAELAPRAEMMETLGLPADVLQWPVAELSEGQAARIGLARAVAAGPSVLLLDEPTAALDEESADRVESFLRQVVAAAGVAVLWVLHDTVRAAGLPCVPLRLPPMEAR